MSGLLGLVLANVLISGLLALLAWALSRRLRRQSLVHGLWVLALVKLVTPPLLPLPLLPGEWSLPGLGLPVGPATVVVEAPSRTTRTPRAAVAPGTAPAPAPGPTESPLVGGLTSAQTIGAAPRLPEPVSSGGPLAPSSLAGAGILLGALVVVALGVLRVRRFRRLLRLATPAPPSLSTRAGELAGRLGLRRAPPVLLLPGRVPPMLWPSASGPLLLLPARLLPELSEEERDTLLVHELAHVRRRDHWVRLLELLVTTLFWWYPVTWWARRALRRAEERCCDEWVLRMMPDSAPAYAQGLLKSLDLLVGEPDPLPVGASGAGPVRDLQSRLEEIVMTTRPTPPLTSPARVALAVAALLGLAVFPTQAQSTAPGEQPVVAVPAEATAPVVAVVPVPTPASPMPAPRPVVAPAPAPRPVVAPLPTPAAAPRPAPRPVVALGESPEDDAELRELEEQQLRLEARRNALHRAELARAREHVAREAAAQQEHLEAEAARLRAAGEDERAAKVDQVARSMAARMDVQRRDVELELARMDENAQLQSALRAKADALRAAQREGAEQEAAALRTELQQLERQHIRHNLAHEERQIALQRETLEIEHRAQQAEVELQMLMAAEEDAVIRAEMEPQQQRMAIERGLHERELEIHEAEQAVRQKELEVHELESAGRHDDAESARLEAERMRRETDATRRGLHEERLLQATGELALQMESQLEALRQIQSEGADDGPEVEREIERLEGALAALRQ